VCEEFSAKQRYDRNDQIARELLVAASGAKSIYNVRLTIPLVLVVFVGKLYTLNVL